MKVLVLTLSIGSGHVKAARSIASALTRLSSDVHVQVCDALDHSYFLFRAAYVWPYWAMIRYAPALWEHFFRSRVANRHERTAPARAFRSGCSRLFSLIKEFDPDVIVASEVAACEIAVIAKGLGLTGARIVGVITDHEAEPVWVKPEVDAFAAPDEYVRDQLLKWGAPEERIVVCGIPVDPAFSSRELDVRRKVTGAVEPDPPLVLLMGGGMGPTRMDRVAQKLAASRFPMRIVAVTGHDRRARRRLSRLQVERQTSLQVLGWTDEVPRLMREASILVTKPGGLTLAEASVCSLPVVIFDPIPGPEQRNAVRLSLSGAGIVTRGSDETAATVISLLRNTHARKIMSGKARLLASPGAAEAIASLTLEVALGVALGLDDPATEARRMTA